ncbi:hypothetical protein B0H10DRAFT_2123077 [Mycena sp. CBHHK59/15]|nr:hypothetical protein B0H10DRAFT_2123077 [Mycena sp. CBHHK59/15]
MSVPLEFDEDGDRPIFGEDGEALSGNGEDHTRRRLHTSSHPLEDDDRLDVGACMEGE